MTRDNRKQDQQARAAWMYYVAGQTQDDIARALGVSRQTAQRLVAQAMASGMVKVRIDHPLARCRDLADRLRARWARTRAGEWVAGRLVSSGAAPPAASTPASRPGAGVG